MGGVGSQLKIEKTDENSKIGKYLHASGTDRPILMIYKIDSKVKIFDIFGDSHPFSSNQRVYFFFDIQSTLGDTLVHFSKKSKFKNFSPKSLNLPYLYVIVNKSNFTIGKFEVTLTSILA